MTPAPASPWRWVVCGLLLLATTLNYMDRVALNQLSVRITDVFGLSAAQYGLIESAFSVAFAIGTLATGWLVDRGGVRWIYPLAVAGWSLAGFATGFAGSLASLLACRFALGLFEAGNWPCGVRTVRTVMPPEQRSFGNSLFQSGTAIGAIVTPFVILACLRWFGKENPDVWRWPFLVIGAIGFAWVAAWLLLPGRVLETPVEAPTASPGRYVEIFRDARFYVLVAVILGVNYVWHTYRIWLPKYLVKSAGYGEEAMQKFSIAYYVAADVGAWTVGLATWLMAKKFFALHSARLVTFAVCTACVLAGAAIPWLTGNALLAALLVVGFGALGLFPTYFALSQELSATHQGKVTGTLGFINAMALAAMSFSQGKLIDLTGRTDLILATAGLPAVVALAVTLAVWRK